jgi:hypothetical protein
MLWIENQEIRTKVLRLRPYFCTALSLQWNQDKEKFFVEVPFFVSVGFDEEECQHAEQLLA